MLSRLAFKKAVEVTTKPLFAVSARNFQTSSPNNERDLVNFPKRVRLENCPPTRLGILPESWFDAVAEKTGSTGMYTFIGTFATFLLSKELWILDHEFLVGVGIFIIGRTLYVKFGPEYMEHVAEQDKAKDEKFRAFRHDEIDRCVDAIKDEEHQQWQAGSYEQIIEAKKENVGLQLEAAYRERLQEAFNQVKNRLDYQAEVGNVHRRVEQKHMVDWIINGVTKNISAKQEDDALKKCIADLKTLA